MGQGAYTLFKVDGRPIAGGMDMSFLPDDVPPHWLVYFTVANTEDAAARVKELGGTILSGPQPTPMGPMAVIDDPVNAAFAIIQFSQQS
jgi:predicted enzyme related to lactoylglutathione lyase